MADDEVTFDLAQIKNIGRGLKKVFTPQLITILLVLIPIIITIVFRMQAANLPISDQWAKNSVINYYRSNIQKQVAQQYPNLPPANRDQFVNEQLGLFLKENSATVQEQIRQTSQQLKKGFQLEQGGRAFTYLGDLDSYYFLRQARNLIKTGTACDERRDGVCYDNHVLAPLGATEDRFSLHAYFIAFTYYVVSTFDKGIPLMYASFLVPTIVAVLAALSLFFLIKRIVGNAGAFFGSLLLAVTPVFLSRTMGSDNDIWNVLFPIVILLFYIIAWEVKRSQWRILYSILTGLLIGLFAWAWQGFWFVFYFLVAMTLAVIGFYIIQYVLKHKKIKTIHHVFKEQRFKHLLVVFSITILSTLLFVLLLGGYNSLIYLVKGPLSFITIKAAVKPTLWPNVYTTVAELGGASLSTVVAQVGGKFFYFVALFGLISTMLPKRMDWKEWSFLGVSILIFLYLITDNALRLSQTTYLVILAIPLVIGLFLLLKHPEADVKYAILLTVWFIATIYASAKGVRFIFLIIPAVAVGVGVGVGFVYNQLVQFVKKWKFPQPVVHVVLLIIIFLLFFLGPVRMGNATAAAFAPSINDGWWNSLSKINEEAAPDAIINSWWDFGHWFKYVADRRVTLDGATQNHPNAHWLGKLMLTSNEQESLAILRMLDCGSNNAFETINDKYDDAVTSKVLLDKLIMLSKDDGRQLLEDNGFTDDEVTTILGYTHCNPPEDYFITSQDMVGKAGVWAHFGAWNFTRAYIAYNIRGTAPNVGIQELQERFNYTSEEAQKLYYEVQALANDRAVNDWVAPWPSYLSGSFATCSNVNETPITCDLNFRVSQSSDKNVILKRIEVDLNNIAQTKLDFVVLDRATNMQVGASVGVPTGVAIAELDGLKRYGLDNATFEADLLFVRDDNNYRVLLLNKRLTESVFTKLFFLDGNYLEHFERFSDVVSPTGQRIIVWKVNWPVSI